MHIGFTGTTQGMKVDQWRALNGYLWALAREGQITTAHHGMCKGADSEFDYSIRTIKDGWPEARVILVGHPGVTKQGKLWLRGGDCYPDFLEEEKQFIDRNHVIVDITDVLLACPKEMNTKREDGTWTPHRSGTWATIRYAEARGKKVTIFWPDATVTSNEV